MSEFVVGEWRVARMGVLRIREVGSDTLRLETQAGMKASMPLEAARTSLRRPVDRDTAEHTLALLCSAEGDLDRRTFYARRTESLRAHARGSYLDRVTALRRLYRSPYALSWAEKVVVFSLEEELLQEIALVLGIPASGIVERIRAVHPSFGAAAPERPWEPPPWHVGEVPSALAHLEVVGRFVVRTGRIVVGDPYTLRARDEGIVGPHDARGCVSLSARNGTWWAATARDPASGREATLVVVHESLLATLDDTMRRAEHVANLMVDEAQMAVVDAALRDESAMEDAISFRPALEGILLDAGCHVHTGFGDGVYPLLVAAEGSQTGLVAVSFIDRDEEDEDGAPPR